MASCYRSDVFLRTSRMLIRVSRHSEFLDGVDTHAKAAPHGRGKELPRERRRICHRVRMVVVGEVKVSGLLVLLPPSWPGEEQSKMG